MEPKDWIALLLSGLALVVSLILAMYTFRREKAWRIIDNKLDTHTEYKEAQQSMEYICLLDKAAKDRGTTIWCRAYYGLPYVPKHPLSTWEEKQQIEQLLELGKHRRTVDTFWDKVMQNHAAKGLPKDFFKADGGWIKRANNYRLMAEPLYIANHYRAEFDKEDGPYLKERPKRFEKIEQLWRERQGPETLKSSTIWADKFEAQKFQEEQQSRTNSAAWRRQVDFSTVLPTGPAPQAAATPAGAPAPVAAAGAEAVDAENDAGCSLNNNTNTIDIVMESSHDD